MDITLNSIGFFFKSWGEDGSFQGRRCIILYFLAFLKKTALQILHVVSKYYFKTIYRHQAGIPKPCYPSTTVSKLLKKAHVVLGNSCCPVVPPIPSQG